MAMTKKRTLILVEKNVQGALGLQIAAHWLIFLAISVFVSCALRMLTKIDHSSLSEGIQAALMEQVGTIVVLLALLPWFIHDSLKLSNRFAGPMVRLQKSMVQLTYDDDLPPVTFRKGDFWQGIAKDFNNLRSRVLDDRKALAEAVEGQDSRDLADTVAICPAKLDNTLPGSMPVQL